MASTAKMRRKTAPPRRIRRTIRPEWSERQILEGAGRFPVLEVLLTKGWAEGTAPVRIVVARQLPSGPVAAGVFLVDLACLGVKRAFARVFPNEVEYRRTMRARATSAGSLTPASLDLAAKISAEGIRYAQEIGFGPVPEYRLASRLLSGADPAACADPVRLGGRDGKPLYVSGPEDDPDQIVRILTERLGRGGFHFVVR